jgi:hypothetical protein
MLSIPEETMNCRSEKQEKKKVKKRGVLGENGRMYF